MLAASHALATNTSWINASGGAFATPSNWTAGVPDADDLAILSVGASATYSVALGNVLSPNPIHPTVDTLHVGPNTVNLLGFAGSTLTIDDVDALTSGNGGLLVGLSNDPGNGPPAILNVNLGALTTTTASIGHSGDGTIIVNLGTFTVASPIGTSTFSNGLRVGHFGSGYLRVRNGADLIVGRIGSQTSGYTQVNGNGAIELTDPGTTFNTQGLNLDGIMSISNGATATTNGTAVSMGFQGSSDSVLTVTDSSFSAGDMLIGGNGTGSVTVSAGGILNCGNVRMGESTAVVSGLGSHWTMSGDLSFGPNSPCGISILNGAEVRNAAARLGTATETFGGAFNVATVLLNGTGATWRNTGTVYVGDGIAVASINASLGSLIYSVGAYLGNYNPDVGFQFRATGSVNLTGNGTAWTNTGAFYVGYGGNGRLSITGGAKLTTDSVYVGAYSGSNGSIDVSGSNSKLICGSLNIGVGSAAMTALVSVRNGGVMQGQVNVGSFGQLSGDGTVVGSVSNAGLISPGSSPATLNVTGSFSQSSSGKLLIEIASASSYDKLVISGAAALNGGSMRVAALDSYIPLPGTSYAVMTYASHVGNTLNVLNETGYPGLRFTPTFGLTSLTLLSSAVFAGDADLDGDVDVADLGALATNWQSNANWLGGDFDFNGTVNVNDLGLLASNWQAGVAGPSGPSLPTAMAALGLPQVSIPEPAGAVLLIELTLLAASPRSRRPGRSHHPRMQ
jgi:T5SS/PEP-CTERM-associated repeat protein